MKQVPEGWLDWNTLSLDQMVEHLRNKYEYSSTGDAMCIHRLIEFYEKNKKGDLQSFIGPEVPGIMIDFDLLCTEETPNKYHKTELTIGINGQKALLTAQLFTMARMYKNWNDWRVKLGVWLIKRTEL